MWHATISTDMPQQALVPAFHSLDGGLHVFALPIGGQQVNGARGQQQNREVIPRQDVPASIADGSLAQPCVQNVADRPIVTLIAGGDMTGSRITCSRQSVKESSV